ncbi:hypothetical protein N7493_000741 [Penicillium malachiteum]|uniref:Uncharacterized protein n=1 Tax=Penicillium malachiteum TaxID=1324776 RepID=A0AAD6HWX1_9EURO|nr:hypothetical protein N7493_000741 [Penicillium malachiteum]
MSGLSVEVVKSAFQRESLVLATRDSQPGWYKPSECLWSSIEQPGKAILKEYPVEFNGFFIESLGVQPFTIQMVYNDLFATNEDAEISEIKSKIKYLNAFLSAKPCDFIDPETLMQKSIFPILYPGGPKVIQPASVEFAIVDREYLASYFRKAIKMLDFTQEVPEPEGLL